MCFQKHTLKGFKQNRQSGKPGGVRSSNGPPVDRKRGGVHKPTKPGRRQPNATRKTLPCLFSQASGVPASQGHHTDNNNRIVDISDDSEPENSLEAAPGGLSNDLPLSDPISEFSSLHEVPHKVGCRVRSNNIVHMGLQGRAFQGNIYIEDMVFLGDTRSAEELAVFTNMAPEQLCLRCGLRVGENFTPIFPGERGPLFATSVKLLQFALRASSASASDKGLTEEESALLQAIRPLVTNPDCHFLAVLTALVPSILEGRTDCPISGVFGAGKTRAAAAFFLLHAAKVRSSCEEGPGQSALQSAYHNPKLDVTELKQNRTP